MSLEILGHETDDFDLEQAVNDLLDACGVRDIPPRVANVDRERARVIVEIEDVS